MGGKTRMSTVLPGSLCRFSMMKRGKGGAGRSQIGAQRGKNFERIFMSFPTFPLCCCKAEKRQMRVDVRPANGNSPLPIQQTRKEFCTVCRKAANSGRFLTRKYKTSVCREASASLHTGSMIRVRGWNSPHYPSYLF